MKNMMIRTKAGGQQKAVGTKKKKGKRQRACPERSEGAKGKSEKEDCETKESEAEKPKTDG
ncbi:MAG: hypothetical protein ACLQOO_03600 [Terriglobia bacterium]